MVEYMKHACLQRGCWLISWLGQMGSNGRNLLGDHLEDFTTLGLALMVCPLYLVVHPMCKFLPDDGFSE